MPKDRFRQSNARDDRRRQSAREDRAAEKAAEQGQFKCAECRQFKPLEDYQYEFRGEVKVARRCEFCRWYARRERSGHEHRLAAAARRTARRTARGETS